MTWRRENSRVPAGNLPSSDGFVLLHVWLERDSAEPLRIRLTAVADLEGARLDTVATASPTVAVEYVREWLERFLSSNAGPDAPCPSEEVR
jgi:hypothetical protein